MADVVEVGRGAVGGSSGSDAARRYAPLLSMLVAAAIVLAVLPSALNLPQSNPTQTLEYAPVPPEDDDDTPPQGNLSALGLGSSSGINGEGAQGEGPGGGPPEPAEEHPQAPPTDTDFRCVGNNPARQTEDPLAPPCVPFFDGDNYGATYRGVTGKEVRLLVYIDGSINYISASNPGDRTISAPQLVDLHKEPDPGKSEHLTIKALRAWQKYFNLRFQKYGRQVHFWVYYSSARTSDTRREDAAQMLQAVDPFAVISFASEGFEDDFLKAMARKGVLNFGSFNARPAQFFQNFPKMIWGYLPSAEQQALSYVSYICQKVVNKPAVLAGGLLNGQPRKLGMIYTIDEKQEGLRRLAEVVKQGVTDCGGKIEATAPFSVCCLAQNGAGNPSESGNQMAEFSERGITTILWPGGINGDYGRASSGQGYFPEWIIAGDSTMDANYPINLSSNSAAFDGRAIVITPQTLEPALRTQRCYQAYREVDQDLPDADLRYTCEYYRDLFQFFTGIQVAGPRLGPTSIDKGFHEIPHKYVGTPTIPACFYEPDDYSCVKDAQAEIWRANEVPPGSNQPGCWAAIDKGQRYAPGKWPAGNITMGANGPIDGTEPCNGYDNSVRFNT